MDFNGLSIDQAPPILAPLRFFITAPIFGILAGVLLLFSDSATLMSRYSIDAIVVAHLITIGVFGSIMLGALTQMLPVLASANIPKVKTVATFSHAALLLGLFSMAFGLEMSNTLLLWLASLLLGSGFLVIIGSMLYAIKGVQHFTASIKGMLVSLIFAFMIVLMGVYLLYGYGENDVTELHYIVANIHSVWAVFGFAGILIIGVAFQVLPMFYVAPRFKQFCKRRVVLLISTGLLIWMVLSIFAEEYALYAKLWIATFFWAFATTVWIKFNKRKRPVSDVTVWYWRAASLFLTLGSFLWIYDEFFKHEYIVMVGILIGGGFILSIMLGMLYKIVPFLVWFHLNALGYMTIPTMNEMINKNLSRLQFVLFILSLVGFVFSFYMPGFLMPSSLSFIVSMAILEYNILAPVWIYRATRKKKPDFDMSAFSMT
ncbi:MULTISPECIES: hypothetical protein [Sulfurimonas]|uniref:hypothetical protein n=1 Tax=Sulfurimonas TaxID=202746 RepID=UPI001264FAF3|nr:hypothetical protein [Sulfurimonas indica]